MESLGGESAVSAQWVDPALPPKNNNQSARQKPHQDEDESLQEGVIVWKYPCGDNFLRLETPENMTKEVWDKLNKYIQVLEP